jgi:hypothetical protein
MSRVRDSGSPVRHHLGYGCQNGTLGHKQIMRVSTGPIQQGQLDQKLGPDVTGVLDRLLLPCHGGRPPSVGDLDQQPGRPLGRVFLPGRADQAQIAEPVQGTVNHRLLDVPDIAQVPVPG